MERIVIHLLMVQKLLDLKQKILNCSNFIISRNVSKDFCTANMKKPGLVGSVFDVSVDYNVIAVNRILDMHKCLMKKNGIV